MELTEREKCLLVDAISYYYVNYIYNSDSKIDCDRSDLDYEFRDIAEKIGIKEEVQRKNMDSGYQF